MSVPPRKPTDPPVALRPIKTLPRSILPPRAPTPPPASTPAPSAKPAFRRPPPIALPVAPVAPGVNRGATLSTAEMDRMRRRERRARDRATSRRWIALSTTALAMIAAFVGGYLWKSGAMSSAPATAPADTATPEQQRQALALMDDAVRAKRQENYEDAINAVAKAREADPAVRGGDALLAEIAYRRKDSSMVNRFAREALRRGENVADVHILLSLDKWRARELPGSPVAGVDDLVAQLLMEGSHAEMWNGIPRFFLGDLQGLMGRASEGQRTLLGSLHRMHPWGSIVVISAKKELAAAESGVDVAETPAGSALVNLRRALLDGADVQPHLASLRALLAASQVRVLLGDPSFQGAALPAPLMRARRVAPDPIPYGTLPPPDDSRPPLP